MLTDVMTAEGKITIIRKKCFMYHISMRIIHRECRKKNMNETFSAFSLAVLFILRIFAGEINTNDDVRRNNREIHQPLHRLRLQEAV